MKGGAENRKKTITLGVLIAVAAAGLLYNLYSLFGGPSTPPPSVAPLSSAPAPALRNSGVGAGAAGRNGPNGTGAIAGVDAKRLASTSASLDPTLDQTAMLRTESLVYSGSGRNIFSATYTAPAAAIPTNVPPPRPSIGPVRPTVPVWPVGPAPPPAIPLKFFGTAQRSHGMKQALLLSGEDVYVASTGDIVAKRYKVDQILPNGIQVTDLLTNNTQTLPMQQQ